MFVFRRVKIGIWAVGFFTPKGEWESESEHNNVEAAAKRVHYLNGGGGATADDIMAAALYLKGS